MQADDTQLRKLLHNPTQYVIPLFQRTYSWDEDDWKALWDDVLETYEAGSGCHHFLGSIVSKTLPGGPGDVGRFLVIDGQQRLTTLTILLAALRDAVRSVDSNLAEKMHSLYLTNIFETGLERYKLVPTQADRAAYFEIIDGSESHGGTTSCVREAYDFFCGRLKHTDFEGRPLDLKRVETVVLGGFELVSIALSESDNEFRIFESLNAKGAPLAQADLLRNYLFMRLPEGEHEAAYHELWLPLQESLGLKHLDGFIRYSLLSRGQFVREGDVYQIWKGFLDKHTQHGVLNQLREFARIGRWYLRLVSPEFEPNGAIASHLKRLNRWGGQTIYPFLLNAYRWKEEEQIDEREFVTILEMVESFLVRRLFANVPTNTLNRLFLRLAHQLPEGTGRVEAVRKTLSEPGRRWPTDDEFRDGILHYPLYLDSRPEQRRLILELLERSYPHKEEPSLDKVSVEHVMPQTLSSSWRTALDPNADAVHQRLLHVLGNLTLSAYNQEMSNAPFAQKRGRYATSNLHMNRMIADHDEWTEREIDERGKVLSEQAVDIWPGPSR